MVKIVQGAPGLSEALDELRRRWQPSSIIHGDLKWDNVVLVPRPSGRRPHHVQFVDWEMVQFGDPLWDAASFLAQHLDVWIGSMPVAAHAPRSDSARLPLDRLKPAMRQFWQAYRLGANEDDHAVERVVRYAAARLVQFAIEADQQSAILSANGVIRLQVAHNMMQRPMTAVRTLLGLEI